MPKIGSLEDLKSNFADLCASDDGPQMSDVQDFITQAGSFGVDVATAAHLAAHIGVEQGLFDPEDENEAAAEAQDAAGQTAAA